MTAAANPDTVREGQTGTVFRVTIKDDADDSVVDVSNNDAIEIKAKKPDGTTIAKAASFTSDGTDGQIEYQDDAGDFTDQTGSWTFWGRADLTGGGDFPSTALSYIVEAEGS